MIGHGGNMQQLADRLGCKPSDILDFSANINPLGPPEYIWNVLARNLPDIIHYPDSEAAELVSAIAKSYRLQPDQVVVGNGTSELLFAALRAIKVRRAIIPVPAYIDYRQACEQAAVPVHSLILGPEDNFQPDLEQLTAELRTGDLVILGQPNNPTGKMVDRQQLLNLAEQNPEVMFLVDEAFAGFVADYSSLAGCSNNIIVLCSLTKLFAVPGLRLGFLAASLQVCRKIRQQLSPWSVNSLAQAAGAAMVGDTFFIQKSCELVSRNRQFFCEQLEKIPSLKVVSSAANFLLLHLNADLSATELADNLLQQARIAVRVCDNYEGLDDHYLRIAVRSRQDNEQLIRALRIILQPESVIGTKTI